MVYALRGWLIKPQGPRGSIPCFVSFLWVTAKPFVVSLIEPVNYQNVIQPQGGVLMKKYDVIAVGSGAGGATAAWVFATRGASVLLLEAGRMLIPAKDFRTHTMPWELPFRGEGKPGEYDGLWKINEYTDHLYTNPRKDRYDSLEKFHWTRLRGTGGRTNTWGRACFRHGHMDFKTRTTQAFGEDWPIDYDDLSPYY